jgi:hypothetical protein
MAALARLAAFLVLYLTYATLASANPAPAPAPAPTPSGILSDLLSIVGNIGNAPPPPLFWTPNPSPECAAINKGQLQCCRATLAGDLPLIVFLAAVYGYKLNPNDVNGIVCESPLAIHRIGDIIIQLQDVPLKGAQDCNGRYAGC